MYKLITIICFLVLILSMNAQKVIHNPNSIAKNFSASVTKVSLMDTATVLSFHLKAPIGYKFAIPKETYIENAAKGGQRLYITGAKDIGFKDWYTISNAEGMRYDLIFPPLKDDVKKINYGESNPGGGWFIYKLDLSQDGKSFLPSVEFSKSLEVPRVVIGYPRPDYVPLTENKYKFNLRSIDKDLFYSNSTTILPKDLPKAFLGNWYDKYGTLLLIAKPEYLVLDSRIRFYDEIREIGDSKYEIHSGGFKALEILNLESEDITVRTDKLMNLKKESNTKKPPNYLKGKWVNLKNKETVEVHDDYFVFSTNTIKNANSKSYIDTFAASENVFWFVIYNSGNYSLYTISKVDDKLVLKSRSKIDAVFQKE